MTTLAEQTVLALFDAFAARDVISCCRVANSAAEAHTLVEEPAA